MVERIELDVDDDLLREVEGALRRKGGRDMSASELIEGLLADWLAQRGEVREPMKGSDRETRGRT